MHSPFLSPLAFAAIFLFPVVAQAQLTPSPRIVCSGFVLTSLGWRAEIDSTPACNFDIQSAAGKKILQTCGINNFEIGTPGQVTDCHVTAEVLVHIISSGPLKGRWINQVISIAPGRNVTQPREELDVVPGLKPLFTADQEACFGRVYAKRHLTSHPNQKVTSLYVFRYLQQRSDAENWRPNDRQEAIERFRQSGTAWVQAFVRVRDRPGHYHNWLVCSEGSGSSAHCFVECDGGTFDMKRESATTVLLYNHGFELVGGCAQPDNIERVDFLPGEDDKLFRLESVPVAVCRAEEEKAMPIRAGRPLRERFGQDEVFCFGRDYDPGHLAGHPQQHVTSIRIGRLAPEKEWVYNDPTRVWPDDVRLTVSLKLKAGAARRGLQYVCRPQEASWRCTAESSPDAISSCGDGTIYLTRTSGEDIVLINPREGLPIETACQAQPPSERALTHSDDKVFRVTQMPIAACR